ncbi:MAG: universal stress protein [Proteobacteria bacterium]|nr:universal stress protein [Pseudomonadota bacterium]
MQSQPQRKPSIKATKYLVCVDAREESKIALRLACMKANARGSEVCMLHVIQPADFQTLGAIADRMREERRQEGQELLSTLAEEAYGTYGIRPVSVLREGSIGDEIIAAAYEDAEVNMIALGIAQHNANGGRGKLAAWLASQLGSKLYVPLLMVPGNLTDQQLQTLV